MITRDERVVSTDPGAAEDPRGTFGDRRGTPPDFLRAAAARRQIDSLSTDDS
jgi:hypothetical protein